MTLITIWDFSFQAARTKTIRAHSSSFSIVRIPANAGVCSVMVNTWMLEKKKKRSRKKTAASVKKWPLSKSAQCPRKWVKTWDKQQNLSYKTLGAAAALVRPGVCTPSRLHRVCLSLQLFTETGPTESTKKKTQKSMATTGVTQRRSGAEDATLQPINAVYFRTFPGRKRVFSRKQPKLNKWRGEREECGSCWRENLPAWPLIRDRSSRQMGCLKSKGRLLERSRVKSAENLFIKSKLRKRKITLLPVLVCKAFQWFVGGFLSAWKSARLFICADKDKCLWECLGLVKSILDLKWHKHIFFSHWLHRAAGRAEDRDLCLCQVYF